MTQITMQKWLKLAGCLGIIASFSACATGPVANPGMTVSQPIIALGQEGYVDQLPRDYILRASDVVSIDVFREENLSIASVPISAEGRVSVPLVGSIMVAGMTPQAAEERMEQLLGARYLRDPEVTVNVLRYDSHQFTIDGAVAAPGFYGFNPGMRLSGGVSMAGGPNRVADLQEVAVFRETNDGIEVAKFNYAAIRSGSMLDPVLLPGDRVVVGTDGMSQFWQDVLRALPAFALFTNIRF